MQLNVSFSETGTNTRHPCTPKGLGHLRKLDLSHNVIESTDVGAFRDVAASLRELDLSDNRLAGVPADAFASVSARVRLARNPWHCGCTLQEALRHVRLDPETAGRLGCATASRPEFVGLPVVRALDSGVNFCNFHHRTTDVAMFVAMFCWFSMVTAYVVCYVRHNQEDARRHVDYLKSLPDAPATAGTTVVVVGGGAGLWARTMTRTAVCSEGHMVCVCEMICVCVCVWVCAR